MPNPCLRIDLAGRMPTQFVLQDMLAMLADFPGTGLDDLLSLELERIELKIGRAQNMLETVIAIVETMERCTRQVLQDARSFVEIPEQFDPEELDLAEIASGGAVTTE